MMTKGLRRDRNIIANGMIFFFFALKLSRGLDRGGKERDESIMDTWGT